MEVRFRTRIFLLFAAHLCEDIPYWEEENIDQALAYAAWRIEDRKVSLPVAQASQFGAIILEYGVLYDNFTND